MDEFRTNLRLIPSGHRTCAQRTARRPWWRWRVVLFAVVSLVVVRVVAVVIALAGSGLSAHDTLFIGWLAPAESERSFLDCA